MRSQQVERLLAELGYDWELPRIPLAQIDRTAPLAHRFQVGVDRRTKAMNRAKRRR